MSEHLMADFFDCEPSVLTDPEFIETTLAEAVSMLGLTILEKCTRKYSPEGVTTVFVLAESHISIHTWPERRFAGLDIYTCGDTTTSDAYEYLKKKFEPADAKAIIVERGPESREKNFQVNNLDIDVTLEKKYTLSG